MAHMTKVSKSAVGALLRHNRRLNKEYSNENIDKTRTHLNYSFCNDKRTEKEIFDYAESYMKRKRKDANYLISWVVSKPVDVKEGDEHKFFKAVNDFLIERYGQDENNNIVYSEVHLDESNPHLHFGFVPLTRDKNNQLCCSAKKVVARKDLQTFHNDLSQHIEQVLGYKVEILNGKTLSKSMAELKAEQHYYDKHMHKLNELEKVYEAEPANFFNAKKQVASLQEQSHEKDLMIDSLTRRLELTNNIEKVDLASVTRAKKRINILNENVNDLNEQISNLTDISNYIKSEIERDRTNLNNINNSLLIKNNDELYNKYDEVIKKDDPGLLHDFINMLMKFIQRLIERVKKLELSIGGLKRSVDAKEKEIATMQDDIRTLVKEKNELINSNDTISKANVTLQNEKTNLQKALRESLEGAGVDEEYITSFVDSWSLEDEVSVKLFLHEYNFNAKINGSNVRLQFNDQEEVIAFVDNAISKGLDIEFEDTKVLNDVINNSERLQIEKKIIHDFESSNITLAEDKEQTQEANKFKFHEHDIDI